MKTLFLAATLVGGVSATTNEALATEPASRVDDALVEQWQDTTWGVELEPFIDELAPPMVLVAGSGSRRSLDYALVQFVVHEDGTLCWATDPSDTGSLSCTRAESGLVEEILRSLRLVFFERDGATDRVAVYGASFCMTECVDGGDGTFECHSACMEAHEYFPTLESVRRTLVDVEASYEWTTVSPSLTRVDLTTGE